MEFVFLLSYSSINLDIDPISFFFLILFYNGFVFLVIYSLTWLEVLWGCLHWLALLVHLFVNSSTNFSPTQEWKGGLEGLLVACARCGNLMALVNPMDDHIHEGEGALENAYMVYQGM